MSRPKLEKSLWVKLAEVFKAVSKLQRTGTNRTRHYKFTRATDVFEAVRQEIFSRHVLLQWDEGTPEYVDKGASNGGETITECRLSVKYSFTDGKDIWGPFTVNGVGRDVEDKSLYKAQTGAEKALLKRIGLMAEEADDPEWDSQNVPGEESLEDVAPRRIPRKEKPLTDYQKAAILEAVRNTEKTEAQLSEAVAQCGHADQLANVKQKHFKDLFVWASDGKGTIASPKPQAVPTQSALPLRAAPTPIEMRIGNQSIKWEPQPKDKAFSV